MEDFSKGFTHIPHTIYNVLPLTDLTLRERRVVDFIIRLTYGCHLKSVKLKQADFTVINIAPSHVKEVIESLLEKKIIIKNEKTKEYRVNEEYFASKITSLVSDNLLELKTLVGKQIKILYSQKGKHELTEEVIKTLPDWDEFYSQIGNRKQLPNKEEISSNSTSFSDSKDNLKIIKNSDKDNNIADKNLSYTVTDPDNFVVTNESEYAAYEAWKALEQYNKLAFTTTYLSAYRKGLPSHLFFQFTSEIRQDKTITKPGAVFNRKVREFLERKQHEKN